MHCLLGCLLRGARLKIFYDPYFVSTNRKTLPKVEIYSDGKWNVLNANSSMELDFASAGAQKIQVRLSEGNLTVNQNIYVEVR